MRLHGNTKWLPRDLVCLTLFWAWSESKRLTDAYAEAGECCRSVFRSSAVGTYQGLMGALTRWTAPLMQILAPAARTDGRNWRRVLRVGGWVPIAFDGSRSTAPRTRANERAFCAKHYGKGKTAKYRKKKSKGMRRKKNEKNKPQPQEPQAWITLLWHMGLRLPWMWRLGPSNSSERAHVMEMILAGKQPKHTLFLRRRWLRRISALVGHCAKRRSLPRSRRSQRELAEGERRLRAVKKGLVLCWPQTMQAKQPPLRLRSPRRASARAPCTC